MPASIITSEDLELFKKEILREMKAMLSQNTQHVNRKWLKSHEVRRLLTISPGTLQNLRVNGTLPFTKIGGVIFYDQEDIQKMLQLHKKVDSRSPFSLEKRSVK
jgi:hypothetical protein